MKVFNGFILLTMIVALFIPFEGLTAQVTSIDAVSITPSWINANSDGVRLLSWAVTTGASDDILSSVIVTSSNEHGYAGKQYELWVWNKTDSQVSLLESIATIDSTFDTDDSLVFNSLAWTIEAGDQDSFFILMDVNTDSVNANPTAFDSTGMKIKVLAERMTFTSGESNASDIANQNCLYGTPPNCYEIVFDTHVPEFNSLGLILHYDANLDGIVALNDSIRIVAIMDDSDIDSVKADLSNFFSSVTIINLKKVLATNEWCDTICLTDVVPLDVGTGNLLGKDVTFEAWDDVCNYADSTTYLNNAIDLQPPIIEPISYRMMEDFDSSGCASLGDSIMVNAVFANDDIVSVSGNFLDAGIGNSTTESLFDNGTNNDPSPGDDEWTRGWRIGGYYGASSSAYDPDPQYAKDANSNPEDADYTILITATDDAGNTTSTRSGLLTNAGGATEVDLDTRRLGVLNHDLVELVEFPGDSLRLKWPQIAQVSDAKYFRIYVDSTDGGFCYDDSCVFGNTEDDAYSADTNAWTFTNRTPGVDYCFVIRSLDDCGNSDLNTLTICTNEPPPDTIWVSVYNTTGPWTGTLEYPYQTIQDGINAATPDHLILLGDGLYTGNGNRDLDFNGKAIILRSINGPDNVMINCEGNPSNPHRGFLFDSGEDTTSVVEGFHIYAGFIDKGGAAYLNNSSPKFVNCVFSGCLAQQYGGAFFCRNSSPKFIGCVFDLNTAEISGGTFYCDYSSEPTLLNCTITRNSASQYGGGFYLGPNTVLTLKNSIIAYSIQGEAVHCEPGGSAVLSCCDISGNAGGDWTGCIAYQLGSNGNFSLDPQFCDATEGNYTIYNNSPCAPENNDCEILIGALNVACSTGSYVEIIEHSNIPDVFTLDQNFPNPFNPTTTIRFSLPQNAEVEFTVINIVGQTVERKNLGFLKAGSYSIIWQAESELGVQIPSGVYFYRIIAGDYVATRKMVLLK